ncbi:hypothetical protein JTE90_001429 [Oedothorax gibbosus]|uniref:GH16 domain-containing protein n=1 Tax=Oedothorax gibbosus TaxID=931172 RepID=A0AAV6V292_9ARAC|nr:hypothetical protein JTE90_001429 [Oedothorax gibbosus]
MALNAICRVSSCYPVTRLVVPSEKVSWMMAWNDYSPPDYSAPYLTSAEWADPDITDPKFNPKWNSDDGGIDRGDWVDGGLIMQAMPLLQDGNQ